MKQLGPLALGAAVWLAGGPLAAQQSTPNVLVLIADDLGTDYVRCYTPTAPPTPNIDALAANGLRFTNGWASPVCSPTRANFHTGRYGFRTGVLGPVVQGYTTNLMSLDETTLPELFDGPTPSSYATALIGKWHLDNDTRGPGVPWGPVAHGWDYFAGTIGGAVNDYCHWQRAVATEAQPVPSSEWFTAYVTTRTVDDALTWIGNQSSPWVCCIAFNAPHGPLHAPPSNLHTRTLPALPECSNLKNSWPGYESDFFGAMAEALDTEIGRLLDELALSGELADTDVFFFGDNGTPTCVVAPPFSPYQGKGTTYEGGVRVPFVVSGPSVANPGRDVTDMVHVVDLFRTIAELCAVDGNIPSGVTIDSESLVPYLQDQVPSSPRPFLLAELGPTFDRCGNGRPRVAHRGTVAIRDALGNKLIRWRSFEKVKEPVLATGALGPLDATRQQIERYVIRERFFDLQTDPYESTPLPRQGSAYLALQAALGTFGCGSLCD